MKGFKVIYALFFIASIFYANLRFSGITPRHIMTVVMFIACVRIEKRAFLDKYFKIYLFFVFGFGISSILTGYFAPFLNNLIGFYFVAYVGYWATKILVKKYNAQGFFVNLFVIVGLLDALVTIGQFLYIPFFVTMPDILHTRTDERFQELLESERDLSGIAIPGLIGDDVYNGYFMMVTAILCLYYVRKGIGVLKLIPWLICMIASYMIQERAAFLLAIVLSVLTMNKIIFSGRSQKKMLQMFFFYLVVAVGAVYLIDFLLGGDSRFAMGLEDEDRQYLWQRSWGFIEENFLFGGWYMMLDTKHIYPHNVLVNAWIYGGILGLIVIVILLCKQMLQVIKTCFQKMTSVGIVNLLIGLSFAAFTLNSYYHNVSVVSGDIVVWMLWGAFILPETFLKRINSSQHQ